MLSTNNENLDFDYKEKVNDHICNIVYQILCSIKLHKVAMFLYRVVSPSTMLSGNLNTT